MSVLVNPGERSEEEESRVKCEDKRKDIQSKMMMISRTTKEKRHSFYDDESSRTTKEKSTRMDTDGDRWIVVGREFLGEALGHDNVAGLGQRIPIELR